MLPYRLIYEWHELLYIFISEQFVVQSYCFAVRCDIKFVKYLLATYFIPVKRAIFIAQSAVATD